MKLKQVDEDQFIIALISIIFIYIFVISRIKYMGPKVYLVLLDPSLVINYYPTIILFSSKVIL